MNISLRGHEFTLEHKRLSCLARIHFLANRIVNNWNSLPNHVVNAGSLNIFKNSLDGLWEKQDLLYNYRGVIDKTMIFNSLSATGDTGRQPPLFPPLRAAISVDTIIHNNRLSTPP